MFEHGGEVVLPGPTGRYAKGAVSGSVDRNSGDGHDPGAQGAVGDGFVFAEDDSPAVEVVGDDRAREPGGVGRVVPGPELNRPGFDGGSLGWFYQAASG